MKIFEVIRKPEDDDKDDNYYSLGYPKPGEWKSLKKKPKDKSSNKSNVKQDKPVGESVNEDQIFLFLMDKLESEHPEMIERLEQDEVLDVVMDVADELAGSNQFNSRNADQYIIQILRRLENN